MSKIKKTDFKKKPIREQSSAFKKTAPDSPFRDYWTKENYLLLLLGGIVLIAGYILMSFGPWDNPLSLHVSPIVLLIAYLIIFPMAILFRKKPENSKQNDIGENNG